MVKVLSLRGGGIRGYATALLLAEVEKAAGKQCCELFDLLVGTSIGGILATGLALKIPASDLARIFVEDGASIFAPRPFSKMRLQYLGHPRFRLENLQSALERHFLPETVLAHVFTKLMVCSTRYRGMRSQLWKSWKYPEMSAVQAALSSAAAPTYFEPVTIAGFAYCDGGVYANNPAAGAMVEARKLWPSQAVSLVDIACPDDKCDFTPHRAGYLDVLPHMVNLFMGSGEDYMSYLASQWGHVLSIEPGLHGADPDIGCATVQNLDRLRQAAYWDMERNVADILSALRNRPGGW